MLVIANACMYNSFHFMKKIEGNLFTQSSVDNHKCSRRVKDVGFAFLFNSKRKHPSSLVLVSSAISLSAAPVSARMAEAAPVCVAVWTVPRCDLGSN